MVAKRLFVPILSILVLLVACGQQPAGGGPGTEEVLIPPTTKILTAEDRAALLEVDAEGTLRFTAASGIADALERDDVVVSEPSPAAPLGLLRKVVTVQEEGGEVIVRTVGAELREAVHEGSLSVRLELDENDLASSVALQSGIVVQGFDHTIDTDFGSGGLLRATGSLAIDPILDLDLGISCNDKFLGVCREIPDLNVLVRVGVEETADLRIEGATEHEYDEDFPIAGHDFSPLTFFIGPVPVVLTPRLEIYLTASGSLSAEMSFRADQELTLAGGFSYNSDTGFADLAQNESSFDHSGVDFTGEAAARAALGGRFQLRLYGVVGPYGSLEAGPSLEANQQGLPGPGTLLWELKGCLTGTVGIDSVDVLDLHYDKELFDLCTTFASDGNEPPNVFVQAPAAGSQIFVGDDVALRAVAVDPNGHDVVCEWVSSQAGDPFPVDGCEATVAFMTPGVRTLTVTGTDPAGTSDDGTVQIEVQDAPEVLVTMVTPTEGYSFDPVDEPTTLEGVASGGVEPYLYEWSIAYPTDANGNGGEIEEIGTGASVEWTPDETFDIELCDFAHARMILDVEDADGTTGSRSVLVTIGRQIC